MAYREQDYESPTALATMQEIFGPKFRVPFRWTPEGRKGFQPLLTVRGEIMKRPTLDIKMRAVIIFSTLVALGFKPEAKLYIQGLRNLGFSVEEIAEIILQVSFQAGIPRGVDANILLREVMDEDEERAKAKGFFYRPPRI